MRRLEHVGIATRDAEETAAILEAIIGRRPYATEIVEAAGVRTTFFEAGPAKIELLEALGPDSAMGRYLERHGGGLHHLAFEVGDLETTFARLEAAGFRLLAPPAPGADEKRIFFVHPKDAGGVLIELCQNDLRNAISLNGAGPPGAPACLVIAGPEEWETVRAMARRLRIWYSPSGDRPDSLPGRHLVVAFGASSTVEADVLVDPAPGMDPGSGTLVIDRGASALPVGEAVLVRLPREVLERMPDPAVTLADLIAAHLIA